jgi:acetyl-CoA acetyltransferase
MAPTDETAENVAEKYGINREDQDSSLRSQAASARTAALAESSRSRSRRRKSSEVIDTDEFIRADTTLEILAKLRPAFRTDSKGSVTVGNSSGLNDGAAAFSSRRAVGGVAGAKRSRESYRQPLPEWSPLDGNGPCACLARLWMLPIARPD